MALSLQEQLLQAGLSDKASAKQARADKRKKQKKKAKQKQQELTDVQLAAQQAAEAKKIKDIALNQQKQAELESKAIVAQAKQLVQVNIQPKGDGDTLLNFTDDNLVKRMYVSEEVHKQVIEARLAVVRNEDDYALVPMPVADKIAQRIPEFVVYRADLKQENVEKSEEDDWYAEYEIPDDLTW